MREDSQPSEPVAMILPVCCACCFNEQRGGGGDEFIAANIGMGILRGWGQWRNLCDNIGITFYLVSFGLVRL